MLPDHNFERQFPAMCEPDLEQLARELCSKNCAPPGVTSARRSTSTSARPDATLTTSRISPSTCVTRLDPADPGDCFRLVHDLHSIRDIAVFADGSLNEVFSGVFNRVSFSFGQAIDMEDLIDELEDAPGGSANLKYPPDCSECNIKLEGFRGQRARDPARAGGGQPHGHVARRSW